MEIFESCVDDIHMQPGLHDDSLDRGPLGNTTGSTGGSGQL
jgi:hypothetical protein